MNKEKWISDILQSAKNIKPVESNPYMASRIEAKMQQPTTTIISARWAFGSVVALALVLVINITVWQSSAQSNQSPGLQQLVREYGFGNNDFYSMNYIK
jgi:hypothetical protein